MVCERYLASFGHIAASSAAHSNKKFKAKRVRDDLLFRKEDVEDKTIKERTNKRVFEILDTMEETWTVNQKEYEREVLKKRLAKGKRQREFLATILRKCKIHGGPMTSLSELEAFMQDNKENKEKKKLLRLEIQYQKLTHKADFEGRPDIYKVNGLSEGEMFENLTVLLASDSTTDETTDVLFDYGDKIMSILQSGHCKENEYAINDSVIVVWHERQIVKRYLGFFLDDNNDVSFRVDHLERVVTRVKMGRRVQSDKEWKRPVYEDIQDVEYEQVIKCKPMLITSYSY